MIRSRIRQVSYQSYEISINKKCICTTEVTQKNTKVACSCRYIFRRLMRLRGGMSVINFIDSCGD